MNKILRFLNKAKPIISSMNENFFSINPKSIEENKTSAEITYTFIGLNELGNKINEHSLSSMYKNDLKDWEEEINNYLKNL